MQLSGIFLLMKFIAPIITLLPILIPSPIIQDCAPTVTLSSIQIEPFWDKDKIPMVVFCLAWKFIPIIDS